MTDQTQPEADAEVVRELQYFNDEGALVRMEGNKMPEVLHPDGEWVAYPDFDQLHNGRPIDQHRAAEMAGGTEHIEGYTDDPDAPFTGGNPADEGV